MERELGPRGARQTLVGNSTAEWGKYRSESPTLVAEGSASFPPSRRHPRPSTSPILSGRYCRRCPTDLSPVMQTQVGHVQDAPSPWTEPPSVAHLPHAKWLTGSASLSLLLPSGGLPTFEEFTWGNLFGPHCNLPSLK